MLIGFIKRYIVVVKGKYLKFDAGFLTYDSSTHSKSMRNSKLDGSIYFSLECNCLIYIIYLKWIAALRKCMFVLEYHVSEEMWLVYTFFIKFIVGFLENLLGLITEKIIDILQIKEIDFLKFILSFLFYFYLWNKLNKISFNAILWFFLS